MLRKLKIYHIKFSLTHIYICVLIITCIYLKYEVVVLKILDKILNNMISHTYYEKEYQMRYDIRISYFLVSPLSLFPFISYYCFHHFFCFYHNVLVNKYLFSSNVIEVY